MHPIDTTGKLWNQENSNARLRQIQAVVKAELKSMNADVIHATIVERWAEFCAKPQDQAAFLKEHLPTVRNQYLADAKAKRRAAVEAAQAAQESLRPGEPLAASVVTAVEHKCDHCGKVCASAGALTNHERVHG